MKFRMDAGQEDAGQKDAGQKDARQKYAGQKDAGHEDGGQEDYSPFICLTWLCFLLAGGGRPTPPEDHPAVGLRQLRTCCTQNP